MRFVTGHAARARVVAACTQCGATTKLTSRFRRLVYLLLLAGSASILFGVVALTYPFGYGAFIPVMSYVALLFLGGGTVALLFGLRLLRKKRMFRCVECGHESDQARLVQTESQPTSSRIQTPTNPGTGARI